MKRLHSYSWKVTWHWKIPIFNRKYIFKWWIFHCHVRGEISKLDELQEIKGTKKSPKSAFQRKPRHKPSGAIVQSESESNTNMSCTKTNVASNPGYVYNLSPKLRLRHKNIQRRTEFFRPETMYSLSAPLRYTPGQVHPSQPQIYNKISGCSPSPRESGKYRFSSGTFTSLKF